MVPPGQKGALIAVSRSGRSIAAYTRTVPRERPSAGRISQAMISFFLRQPAAGYPEREGVPYAI